MQLDHRAAKSVAGEHVGFGIVVVVVPLIRRRHARIAPERAGVDGFYIAGELRVTRGIGNVELGLENELRVAL